MKVKVREKHPIKEAIQIKDMDLDDIFCWCGLAVSKNMGKDVWIVKEPGRMRSEMFDHDDFMDRFEVIPNDKS